MDPDEDTQPSADGAELLAVDRHGRGSHALHDRLHSQGGKLVGKVGKVPWVKGATAEKKLKFGTGVEKVR